MDLAEARGRFGDARVARLATVRLQRIANVEHEPRVSALVDAYDEDWSRLWWVRIDGRADIVAEGPDLERVQRT